MKEENLKRFFKYFFMTILVVTGGFDPLHEGHIAMFKHAKELVNTLLVGLNSDAWLINKKGYCLLPYKTRYEVLKNIIYVDSIFPIEDEDDETVCNTLKKLRTIYPKEEIIFANGGDRNTGDPREIEVCKQLNITTLYGLGGYTKKASSSEFVKRLKL